MISPILSALIAQKIREIRLAMETKEVIVVSDEEEEENDDDVVEIIVIDSDDDTTMGTIDPLNLLKGLWDLPC